MSAQAVNKTDKEQRRRSASQALAASAPSVQVTCLHLLLFLFLFFDQGNLFLPASGTRCDLTGMVYEEIFQL